MCRSGPPADTGDRFAGLRQRRRERGLPTGAIDDTSADDYQALLWVAEGWSDEPLPGLGVKANPADDPETARKEAEHEMARLRRPEAGS